MLRRWIFADQLGPHFLDDPRQPVLLVECKGVFRRRAFHRQKAHLILSALRHRAAELGDQAVYLRTETYREALRRLGEPVQVCHPTSRRARELVRSLGDRVTMLPARGFVTSQEDFTAWADEQRGALRLEDFYRYARLKHRVLVDDAAPVGGRWLHDTQQRRPSPAPSGRLDVPPPPVPREDEIDAEVRRDLDRWAAEGIRFVGNDGPRRFPVTRAEAAARLDHFVRYRLPLFGPYQDAMLTADPFLAHSGLSPAFNLGLLDPMRAIERAERAYRRGSAPLASVEAFVRQLLGWRDYVWHLYWYFEAGSRRDSRPPVPRTIPRWFAELGDGTVQARCLSAALADVRDRGWTHHSPRLMVLGNYALQRGWRPSELVDWFHRCFVDGYEWVMTANVAGMSQFADPGQVGTRPYVASGRHLHQLSDYCMGCRYDPRTPLGTHACPFTAGYWVFLEGARERLRGNGRMSRALRQLDRLDDLPALLAQEKERGSRAP